MKKDQRLAIRIFIGLFLFCLFGVILTPWFFVVPSIFSLAVVGAGCFDP